MATAQRGTTHTGRTVKGPAKIGLRLFADLHAAIYRLSGGRVGGKMGPAPTLILTTVGRKSGKERVTPLLYLADGDNLVVVASMGGAAQNPGWWHNLRGNPAAQVQVGDRTIRVRAEDADTAERERLWPRLVAIFPSYAEYQRATTREIPVIVLHPVK